MTKKPAVFTISCSPMDKHLFALKAPSLLTFMPAALAFISVKAAPYFYKKVTLQIKIFIDVEKEKGINKLGCFAH